MLWFSWICLAGGALLLLVSGVAIVLEKASLANADVGGYYGESRGALSPAVITQLKEMGRPRIPRAAFGSLIGFNLLLVGAGGLIVAFSDGHWFAWIVALALWGSALLQMLAWFRASRLP